MLTALKTSMRILGQSNRDVERALGLSSSYMGRLLAGKMELRFQHIVDIARALGLAPEEILYFAYPALRKPPTEAAQRLRALVGQDRYLSQWQEPPPPPPVQPSRADLESVAANVLRKLFGRVAEE